MAREMTEIEIEIEIEIERERGDRKPIQRVN